MLAIFAFDRRMSAPVKTVEDMTAAKELCARVASWQETGTNEPAAELIGILERGERSLEDWCRAIVTFLADKPPQSSYRTTSALTTALVAIFDDPNGRIEARAAAGHAVLRLDPTHDAVLARCNDATPPLLIAMLVAAAPADPELRRRFDAIAPFLGAADCEAVKRLSPERKAVRHIVTHL